jgi:predicted Zn-dependent protease
MLDYHVAELEGNLREAYRATVEVVELTPDSEWTLHLAGAALAINRPNEAVDRLNQLDPTCFPEPFWNRYWRLLTYAKQWLGRPEEVLLAVRSWRERSPEAGFSQEMRALAALGQDRAVIEGVDRFLDSKTLTPEVLEELISVAQCLESHGHPNQANDVRERADALYRAGSQEAREDPYTRMLFGRALFYQERLEEACSVFEELQIEGSDDGMVRGYLGLIAARRGDREEAERATQWFAARRLDGWAAHGQARIAATLGSRGLAVRFLREAFEEGWPYWWQNVMPEYASLRGYEPFEEFMKVDG